MKEKMHITILSLGVCALMGLTFAISTKDYKEKAPKLNSAPETTVSSKKFVCTATAVSDSSQATKEYNKNIDKWLLLYTKIKTLGGDADTYRDPCGELKGKKRTECNINNIELRGVLNQIKKLEEKLAPYEACQKSLGITTKDSGEKMSGEVSISDKKKNTVQEKGTFHNGKIEGGPVVKDGFPWGKDVQIGSVPGPIIAYTITAPSDTSISLTEINFNIKIPEQYKGMLEFEKIQFQREDIKEDINTPIKISSQCLTKKISGGYNVSCANLDEGVVDSNTSAWYSAYVFPSKNTGNGSVLVEFVNLKYKEGNRYTNKTTGISVDFTNYPRPVIITNKQVTKVQNNGNISTLGQFTVTAESGNLPIQITAIPFQAINTSGGGGFFSNLSLTDGIKNYTCGYYLEQRQQPYCEGLAFDAIQPGSSKKFTLKGKIENAKSGEEYIIYVSGLGFNKNIPNNPIINDGSLQIIVD